MKYIISIVACIFCTHVSSQQLKPGFDKNEYIGLMKVSAQFGDSAYRASLPVPEEYHFIYRSPIVGLDNCWELWKQKNGVAVISIRGTTVKQESWTANFYAAMVSAKGSLRLSETDTFNYELADNPKAAVHVGWLLSTAFLSKTILQQIDSLYKTGSREFVIIGHSQGGAIAYLLTAYLYHLQKNNIIPADIRFKTYCSAGPKPGNLYFAYDYEAATQQGWAYNVVNTADWVPETPVSVQTLDDYNAVNPFIHTRSFIKKQKWPARWALHYAYGRINTPNRKAARNYQKYLGKFVAKAVRKYLPGFQEPSYYNSDDYTRAGAFIVLKADEDYYKKFPQDPSKIFMNHFHQPYLYLVNKL